MTTKKTYECNLCHCSIHGESGRGFDFGTERVAWKAINQAENHICDFCIKCLFASFQDSGIVEQFGSKQR